MTANDTPIFEFEQAQPTLQNIKVSSIKPDTTNATNRAAQSIGALGFVSAIVVRELPAGGPYQYEIVDGTRRVQTARKDQLEEIPALILSADSTNVTTLALRASLNLNRGSNPLAEAEALGDLRDAGATVEQLAKDLGLHPSTINKRLRLLTLEEDFRSALRDKKLAPTAAEQIVNLKPSQKTELLSILKDTGKIATRDIDSVKQAQGVSSLPIGIFQNAHVNDLKPNADTPTNNEPSLLEQAVTAIRKALEAGVLLPDILRAVRTGQKTPA